MKTIFTGSHKTIEEHCTVISLKFMKFHTLTWVKGFISKLVYELLIPFLVNCVNFIKIRPVVKMYWQFKVPKSNNI